MTLEKYITLDTKSQQYLST